MNSSNQPIARLLWQTENGQQELLLRHEDVVTIGRGDANIIVLSSARISRNHAQIEWHKDGFAVRDMSSSNGTFINGNRVEYMPIALRDGDLIMLERIPMRFEEIKPSRTTQDINSLPTLQKVPVAKAIYKPRLVVTAGPETGREIILDDDQFVIGRDGLNTTWTIRLKDNSVSRPHAKIEKHKDSYSIFDLGSANGTTINGLFVLVPEILNDGDVIGIGTSKLTFIAR